MTDAAPLNSDDELQARRVRTALEWTKPANWDGTPEDRWLGATPPPWGNRARCTAHNGDGRRCRKSAIAGGRVCTAHGGRAEQVKRKAALRLLNAVDPMITILLREAMTADRSADRQRAANSILDRAGVGRANADLVTTEVARALLLERIREARRATDEAAEEVVAETLVLEELEDAAGADDADPDEEL